MWSGLRLLIIYTQTTDTVHYGVKFHKRTGDDVNILFDVNAYSELRLELLSLSKNYAGQKITPYLAVSTDHWKIRRQCPTCPTYFAHTVIHHVCKCALVLYTNKGIATVDIEFEQEFLVSWIHTCLTSLEMPLLKRAIQKVGKTHSSHVYYWKNCNIRYTFQLHVKGTIYKK